MKVAVVPFKMSGDLEEAVNLSDIIAFDLIRSGQFDPLPSENMLSLPSNAQEVFFRDWRILKTDYLVIGGATEAGDSKISVFLSYMMLLTKERWREEVFLIDRIHWRDVAHKISDLVYEKVTGIRCLFLLRLCMYWQRIRERRMPPIVSR